MNFLEESRSLESVNLGIDFVEDSLRSWQRRTTLGNEFRSLSIQYTDAMDARALISSIALPKGAHLELVCHNVYVGLNDVLSGISTAHLSNLPSPTSLDYDSPTRRIRLLGPNGSASFTTAPDLVVPFAELPLLPLANVRELNLVHQILQDTTTLSVFPPSFFPALEKVVVRRNPDISHLFSRLFSNPSSCPSLKTLIFVDCDIDEESVEGLTRFASGRKRIPSVPLHRVVILHSDGSFPSAKLIRGLEKHVPVVDVRVGRELPTDLA